MGFRFRKSIKLFGPFKLNLSKTGASVSMGFKGFSLNLGRGKATTTVSAPGTGISYRTTRKIR